MPPSGGYVNRFRFTPKSISGCFLFLFCFLVFLFFFKRLVVSLKLLALLLDEC